MEKCNTVCAYSVSPTHLLLKVRWRTCPPHSRPNMCPFKSWRSEILSCYFWSSNTTSWPNSPKHCVSWPLFKYVRIQNPCLSKTSLFRRLWPRRHRLSVRGTEWWWSWLRTVILLYHRCTMWWPKETEELFSEVLKLLFRNIYRTLKILTCERVKFTCASTYSVATARCICQALQALRFSGCQSCSNFDASSRASVTVIFFSWGTK